MAEQTRRKPKRKSTRKAKGKRDQAGPRAVVLPAVLDPNADQARAPGRPTLYTPELGEKICDLIARRVSVWRIVEMEGMPCEDTLYRWRRTIPEFSENYARAREARADARQDRIDFIAEQCGEGELDAGIARVMIDAEKWQAGKEQPKRYGDRLELGGSVGLKHEDRLDRLVRLEAEGKL